MESNKILLTDSYKVSHWKQYPSDTEIIHSYFESRGGEFEKIVFFGLQYLLKEYLTGRVLYDFDIEEADVVLSKHIGLWNKDGWTRLLNVHSGRLPVKIWAVPEGSILPPRTPLIVIENTDPEFYWLTNYLETLLVQTWYPCTVATQSRWMKDRLLDYLIATGDRSLIDFKLHDFGFRGVSSVESSAIGGAAHLVNFMGTDTMSAIQLVRKYYDGDVAGFSIPASEHSTITSWGPDKEADAMENMLDQYPNGLVACVSDSFDIFNACRNIWGKKLKDKVEARDGTLVVRPDSGDPPDTVMKVLSLLAERFGASKNNKGFWVLNPRVRVIQGDGIDKEMMVKILEVLRCYGWSADNIAFGSGGGLLQKLNRDTCKFAFKCSAIRRSGEWHDVYKDPITDQGKVSKRGRIPTDGMEVVFEDGSLVKSYTFEEVRKRAASN